MCKTKYTRWDKVRVVLDMLVIVLWLIAAQGFVFRLYPVLYGELQGPTYPFIVFIFHPRWLPWLTEEAEAIFPALRVAIYAAAPLLVLLALMMEEKLDSLREDVEAKFLALSLGSSVLLLVSIWWLIAWGADAQHVGLLAGLAGLVPIVTSVWISHSGVGWRIFGLVAGVAWVCGMYWGVSWIIILFCPEGAYTLQAVLFKGVAPLLACCAVQRGEIKEFLG